MIKRLILFIKHYFLRLFCQKPKYLIINLTSQCKGTCIYCGLKDQEKNKKRELSTKKIKNIINQASQLGIFILNITGGEPFLRKDLKEILEYARNKGMINTISTSHKLTKKQAQTIRNVDLFQLSLNGNRKENDISRTKGDYDIFANNIRFLKKFKKKVIILCVISNININSFDHVLRIGKKYNSKCFFQPVNKTYRYDSKIKLSQKNRKLAFNKLLNLKMHEYSNTIGNSISSLKYCIGNQNIKSRKQCNGFLDIVFLDVDGNAYPCFSPKKGMGYDISRYSLKEILKKKFNIACKECKNVYLIEMRK